MGNTISAGDYKECQCLQASSVQDTVCVEFSAYVQLWLFVEPTSGLSTNGPRVWVLWKGKWGPKIRQLAGWSILSPIWTIVI